MLLVFGAAVPVGCSPRRMRRWCGR
jgi:hypothetical protein